MGRHGYTSSAVFLAALPWIVHASLDRDDVLTPALFAAGCGIVSFGLFTQAVRRYRMIGDVPTSTIRGAAMGLVELKGTARKDPPLVSPISGRPCVHYRYTVEARKGSGRQEKWETVLSGSSSDHAFELDDGTGLALVDPSRAEVDGLAERSDEYGGFLSDPMPGAVRAFVEGQGCATRAAFGSDRRLRVGDAILEPGKRLYVIGEARAPLPGEPSAAVVVGPGPVNVISTASERELLGAYRLGAVACLAGLASSVALLGTHLSAAP